MSASRLKLAARTRARQAGGYNGRMGQIVSLLMLWACVPAVCLAQVNPYRRSEETRTSHVEVTPGRFVPVQRHIVTWDLEDGSFAAVHTRPSAKRTFHQQDHEFVSIPWDSGEVRWLGVGVPVSLRAWEGRLHLIVFDRDSDFEKVRFRFYRQDHNVLSEIEPREFPKAIATQNMWLRSEDLQSARHLDPGDATFRKSLTAKIWRQLEDGTEYYDMPGDPVDEGFLRQYLGKHNVLRLNELVKSPTTKPATPPAQ